MTSNSFSVEDLRAAVPATSGTTVVKGLDGNIQIIRDQHGIPHVRATSTHDAFYGQGFATAQDRLWHMDYDRHKAYGRWSESRHTFIPSPCSRGSETGDKVMH